MMRLIEVRDRWMVGPILVGLGLRYDRVLTHPIQKQGYLGTTELEGIHDYFMQGDADVAFYTPMLGILHIHDSPRPWSPEFFVGGKDITDSYPRSDA